MAGGGFAEAQKAAEEQKDMGWVQVGTRPKRPKLGDPLQLYSLVEVVRVEGTGPEALLTVKVVEPYWNWHDGETNFLPQGGGPARGDEMQVKRRECLPANPPSQDQVPDLAQLNHLHEAALLHVLGMRYCGGQKLESRVTSRYCTFIGNICVATNPFAPQGAWVNSFRIEDYLGAQPSVLAHKDRLQPHPWAVADMAYRELLDERKNQAVLICGESGAGKTECSKFVLAYLIGKKESTVPNLAEKLMDTNEPLEAFGNAKTVNNDNSSRFAKCMQIHLDREGRVLGATIQTSLLEKARACAFFQLERSFHIFYMLCYYRHVRCAPEPGEEASAASVDTSDAAEVLGPLAHRHLLPADQFTTLRPGDTCTDSAGVFRERFAPRDIAWFKRVIKAFRVSLGLAGGEIHAMMATLTALLHLGNVDFTQHADAGDATAVTEATAAHVEAAAACLGVADAAALRAELGLERIVMGGQEVSKQLDRARALSARDALCKATFGAVFVDVVARCNASVTGASAQASGRVGVLDIFGFENMQFNSLEQLCINYTNEKLHQIFINEVFETERRVYTEEGLDPGAINFTDNAMVLEMISGHNPHDADGRSGATAAEVRQKIKGSLFGILDDTCKQAKNRGEQYCEGAVAKWRGAKDANGELFEYKDQFAREKFKVVHFAGPVEYGVTEVDKEHFKPPSEWKRLGIQPGCAQIDSFVTKNKDRVPASLLAFLRTHATNAYYTHVAEQAEAAAEASEAAAAAASPSPAGGGSPQRGSPGGGGRGPKTIVAKFSREIEAFFTLLLSGADPKFIRTINPRPKGIPAPPTMGERFHLQRVLAQLRYTGILDTVRVRASGYLIRKRYEDFAPQFIHPCNLLPTAAQQRLQRADGGGGQVAISDHAMALRVRQEPALARQVVEALFEAPELGVTAGETRYGKTMVFIKRLATLATLEATKEARMQRVMRELMAQQRLAALGLGWWRRRGFEAQLRACALLQGAWRRWLELEGPRSRKGRWQALIDLHATFGTALPVAEGWALGALARRYRWAPRKRRAIEEGRYGGGGGGGLIVRRRRPRRAPRHGGGGGGGGYGAGAGAPEGVPPEGGGATTMMFSHVQDQLLQGRAALAVVAAAAGTINSRRGAAAAAAPQERLLRALEGAAAEAGRQFATTPDEAVRALPTRRYIATVRGPGGNGRPLHVALTQALKALLQHRPPAPQLQDFLLKALRGEEGALDGGGGGAGADSQSRHGGSALEWLHHSGSFALLKPALYALDRQRPEEPTEYLATFLATALSSL